MRTKPQHIWIWIGLFCVLPLQAFWVMHLFGIQNETRAPASTRSTHEIQRLNLPPNCIVRGSERGDLFNEVVLSIPSSSRSRERLIQHMRSVPKDAHRAEPYFHRIPRIIFVKPSCASLLEQQARRHFNALRYDNAVQFFDFESSSPRPYCGVPVQHEVCSSLGSRLSNLLVSIDSPSPPSMVQDLVGFLRSGFRDDINSSEKLERLQTSVILYAIEDDDSGNTESLGAHWMSIPETNLFRPTIRTEKRISGTIRYLETQPTQIMEDDAPVVLSSSRDAISYLSNSFTPRTTEEIVPYQDLQRFLTLQAEKLFEFWTSERTRLLDTEFVSNLTPNQLKSDLGLNLVVSNILNPERTREYSALVFDFSEAVIRSSARVLRSDVPPAVHRVAMAYWWSARKLQILFGCDLAESQNLSPERRRMNPLILAQYRHQTCRRQLSSSLYYLLNREIELEGSFDLTAQKFSLIWSMSSRLERVQLLVESMDRMMTLLRSGQNFSVVAFSWLSFHYLQTLAEEENRSVLTWNGMVPADQGDLLQLNRYQNRFQKFLFDIRPHLLERRFAQPELVFLYMTVIEKLASFDSQFVGLLRTEHQFGAFNRSQGADYLSHAIGLTHVDQRIERLRIAGLARISDHAASLYTLSRADICDLWQTAWDHKRGFSPSSLHVSSQLPCINAVTRWNPPVQLGLKPSLAHNQCENQNDVSSCRLVLADLQTEFSCENSGPLFRWITEKGREPTVFRDAYATLRECPQVSTQALFESLSVQLKSVLSTPFPSQQALRRCFNASDWNFLFSERDWPSGFCEIPGMMGLVSYLFRILEYAPDSLYQYRFEDSATSAVERLKHVCRLESGRLRALASGLRVSDSEIQASAQLLRGLLARTSRGPWLSAYVDAWDGPVPADAREDLIELFPADLRRIQSCQSGLRR